MPDDHAPSQTARPGAHRRLPIGRLSILVAALLAIAAIVGVFVWRVASPHYYSTVLVLNDVAFPDAHHAWLAGHTYPGDVGSIRITTNSGATWSQQTSSAGWVPMALAFADTRHGWMVGNPPGSGGGLVLATSDGGATWTRQDLRTPFFLDDITCACSGHCWAVGDDLGLHDSGTVIATTDGGAHWKTQLVTKREELRGVAFADAGHGWAVGDNGIVLMTADGGARWSEKKVARVITLGDVACSDTRHVWCVGMTEHSYVVLATADGGASWKTAYSVSPGSGALSAITFSDEMHGWVVGDKGLILATRDGGATWTRQLSGTTVDLFNVAFADSTHGLAIGSRYVSDDPESSLVGTVLLRTSNGGVTWTQ